MESHASATYRVLFIVRLSWQEQPGPPAWRGEVERLPDGRRLVFEDWEDLVAFLESHLPATLPAGEPLR